MQSLPVSPVPHEFQAPRSCAALFPMTLIMAMACVVTATAARGQNTPPLNITSAQGNAAFDALQSETTGQQVEVTVDGQKLRVERLADQPVVRTYNGQNVGSAIRVWAEILSGPDRGRLVNLQRYKWSPNQEFRLHVQSAYPLSFAVFQSFPQDRPPTRQIVPTDSLPETFSTIPARTDYAVPYKFVTDNDLRDETIQMVFVRADSSRSPQHCLRERQGLRRAEAATEISKGFSEAAGESKLSAAALDDTSRQPIGATPADVGIIFMSPGFIHHGQVTLNK